MKPTFYKIFTLAAMAILIFSCNVQQRETTVNTSPEKQNEPLTTDTIVQPAQANEMPEDLKSIRDEYARIHAASLQKEVVTKPVEPNMPPEAATLTYYTENGKPVKIYHELFSDHGQMKETFYFINGRLFFIFRDNAWGGAGDPLENKYTARYYINNDTLLKKIVTHPLFDTQEDFEAVKKLGYDYYNGYKK